MSSRNFFGNGDKNDRKPKRYGHGGYLKHKGGIRPAQRDPQGACTQQNCNGRPCRRGSTCVSKMFQGTLSCNCVVDQSNINHQCRNDHDCRSGWICRGGQCVGYNESPGYNPGGVSSACYDCSQWGISMSDCNIANAGDPPQGGGYNEHGCNFSIDVYDPGWPLEGQVIGCYCESDIEATAEGQPCCNPIYHPYETTACYDCGQWGMDMSGCNIANAGDPPQGGGYNEHGCNFSIDVYSTGWPLEGQAIGCYCESDIEATAEGVPCCDPIYQPWG